MIDTVPAQEDIFDLVRAGVSGFIMKDGTKADYLKTIRAVAREEKVLPPSLTEALFSQIIIRTGKGSGGMRMAEAAGLTAREKQIIKLIAEGLTNKEIAQNLHVSACTIKSHLHNIFEKLAMHTRLQVAMYAHDSGKLQE